MLFRSDHIEKNIQDYYYKKWVEHFQKQGNIDLSDYWKQVNQPQKSLDKNIKQKDDTMSDEEFDNFVKENYGF